MDSRLRLNPVFLSFADYVYWEGAAKSVQVSTQSAVTAVHALWLVYFAIRTWVIYPNTLISLYICLKSRQPVKTVVTGHVLMVQSESFRGGLAVLLLHRPDRLFLHCAVIFRWILQTGLENPACCHMMKIDILTNPNLCDVISWSVDLYSRHSVSNGAFWRCTFTLYCL